MSIEEELEKKMERIQEVYSRLDFSFLSMNYAIEYKGTEIFVPRFSVHSRFIEDEQILERSASNNFRVYYGILKPNSFWHFFQQNVAVGFLTSSAIHRELYHIKRGIDVENPMAIPLLKSTELYEYSEIFDTIPPYGDTNPLYGDTNYPTTIFIFKNLPKKIINKYKRLREGEKFFACSRNLEANLTTETKEKINQSREFFDKDELYLVGEAKPDEWGINDTKPKVCRRMTAPIIVGIKRGNGFLIDGFIPRQT